MKRILIIKNDKIGDMILSTCVFRELKRYIPKSHITVVASTSNKSIIEKNPYVDSIVVADYPLRTFRDLRHYLSLGRTLRKQRFDIGIDLRGSIINVFFFLLLTRVKYRIGFFNRKITQHFLHYAYKKNRISKHVTQQRIELLNEGLGITSTNAWPEIKTGPEDVRIAKEIMKQYRLTKFICVIPDASLKKKQWPIEKWISLITKIQNNYPKYKVLITGVDTEVLAAIGKALPNTIIPGETINLRALSILLKKSSLVLCQDGGIMHLAWAVNAPLVAIMSDTIPHDYVAPLGKNSKKIIGAIRTIEVEDVLQLSKTLLDKKN